jgi:dihydroorotate dehydrogenase
LQTANWFSWLFLANCQLLFANWYWYWYWYWYWLLLPTANCFNRLFYYFRAPMSGYKSFLKPFLFLLNPEKAHHFTFFCLKNLLRIPGMKSLLRKMYVVADPGLETIVAGIRFPNPVGLAAGLDKDAKMVDEFAALGFGFVEIGTVTPVAQPGNDIPRLFRLPADEALINRMGFNNEGSAAAAARLKGRASGIPVGGNIGKNKNTPNENAADDYERCFRDLYNVVDYFVVNVSSPNTPGLRALQEKEPLKKLLLQLQVLNAELSLNSNSKNKPVFLKIAPDLTDSQLDEIIEVVKDSRINGIVATNTTISREHLITNKSKLDAMGNGGLSGKPVSKRSTEVIKYLHQKSGGKIPIIGVGGIHSVNDALEKLQAGAFLVQLYTGFIYEGPELVKRINQAILSGRK